MTQPTRSDIAFPTEMIVEVKPSDWLQRLWDEAETAVVEQRQSQRPIQLSETAVLPTRVRYNYD